MTILEIFSITVKEYKELVSTTNISQLQFDNSNEINSAVLLRILMIRKYINVKEKLYVKKIVEIIKESELDSNQEIISIEKQVNEIMDDSFHHILSDGTELSQLDTIFDFIYGFHLHGDLDRIERLRKTNALLINSIVFNFVTKFEPILFDLYNLIQKFNLAQIESIILEKAPLISHDNSPEFTRSITKSKFWSNLKGYDLADQDIPSHYSSLNEQEINMQKNANTFLKLLQQGNLDTARLRSLVSNSSLSSWGNFQEASYLIKSAPNIGINNVFRYSSNFRFAFLYIFPNVDNAFVINGKHTISEQITLCFKKKIFSSEYKIYALGMPLPADYTFRENYLLK